MIYQEYVKDTTNTYTYSQYDITESEQIIIDNYRKSLLS